MSDSVPVISYAAEVRRKALHLLALVIPAGILWVGREVSLWILVPLAVLAVLGDWSRQRVAWAREGLHRVFAPLMRPEEIPPFGGRIVFNGATTMMVAAALSVALFPAALAALGLAMQQTGDAAAALVGRKLGRTRWPGSPKSVEGTVAFALVAALTAWVFAWTFGADVTLAQIAAGAAVGAVVEVLPLSINDNLRVPLAASLAMVVVGAV
ncbi:MAG: phosphatidate cytidylyltransferase [Bacteroidota bacterium]